MGDVFCYVVLHYMAIDETVKCIDSLLKLQGDNRIIVVDNASPNNSGETLEKKYCDNRKVTVIINNKNLGFAVGNNIGYQYAAEKYNPKFIVVLNNDVQISQTNFQEIISEFYKENTFDVLGPNIISTSLHINQNPKRNKGYSYEEVINLENIYNKKNNNILLTYLQAFFRRILILKRIVNKLSRRNNVLNSSDVQWNVMLHGACLVFSEKFIAARKKCFYEKTFFYYEAEILQYELERDGMSSVYLPAASVEHHQGISTNMKFDKSIDQLRFKNRSMYDSVRIFREYMELDAIRAKS